MVGECYSCLRRKNRQLHREREQADIIRRLTECVQERNEEVHRLQQKLTYKNAVLRRQRDAYNVVMSRCD